MIRAGIIGGAGYTAGELIRILINHPGVDLHFVNSTSNAGNRLTDVHEGLIGDTDMKFTDACPLNDIDVVFMCSGHGASSSFWKENARPDGLKVIDLSQDFRDESFGYVYGLPELNRERIRNCHLLANPGCFATAIQLSLLPLASAGKLTNSVHITGITGSTGAGVKPTSSTHFSWRDNNLSVYKAFEHQHLKEIRQSLRCLMPECDAELNFIPVRGDFPRGIFVTAYTESDLTEEQARKIYHEFYRDEPFTHISDRPIDLKQAINTNKALLHIGKHGNKLLITGAIDNLLKGASGQAVENMNLMFGLDETTGLKLKPSAF